MIETAVVVGVRFGVNMLTDSVSSEEDMGMSRPSDLLGVGMMKRVEVSASSVALSTELDVNVSNSTMLLEVSISSVIGNDDIMETGVSDAVNMLVKIELVSSWRGLGLNVLNERDISEVGKGTSKFVVLTGVGAMVV